MPPSPSSRLVQPITGAVLAGGLSARMGQDKATLRLADGRMMIAHVMDALRGMCERVVIVGSPNLAQQLRADSIADLRPHCGPLGGIEALLAGGVGERGQHLVCPCDVPLITSELLQSLLESPDKPATVFHVAGKPPGELESLPARLSTAALPTVQKLLDSGQRSVWRLMEELKPAVVEISQQQSRRLHNVNAIDDLRFAIDD